MHSIDSAVLDILWALGQKKKVLSFNIIALIYISWIFTFFKTNFSRALVELL
jgi:hypothetical protein